MPREVRAFVCEFKCGRKAVISMKAAVAHENRCFRNPATRSCQTCANSGFDDVPWGDGESSYKVRVCEVDAMVDGKPQTQCVQWVSRATAQQGGGT